MKANNRTPIATPILIGLSLLSIGVGYITALRALTKIVLPTKSKSPVVEEIQPAKFSPQIYQLEIVNNQIRLIPKVVNTAATSPKLALTEAVKKLLTQSSVFDPTTTIPPQTRLLNLDISKDGVYIDLSKEFAQGGGSSSMIYRVAQVIYSNPKSFWRITKVQF